jgi:hypothetical protein
MPAFDQARTACAPDMHRQPNVTELPRAMARDTGWWLNVLLAMLLLSPMRAQCGPPFQTDDPGVVELGHVELLLFYQSTLAAEARTGTLPGLELHLGILDKTEFDVVAPYAFNAPSGESTRRGYGDTTLGIKYRLIQESDSMPLVSLVPKINLPTGSSGRGLGNGGSQVLLAASAQKSWSNFQTYGNVGYWVNNGPNNRNYWFLGWQAQYQLSDRWILGAELFHTTEQVMEQQASTGFNLGGSYLLDHYNQLFFSAGRGLQNAAQSNRASAYVGYQHKF